MPNIELSTVKADLEKNLKTTTGEEHHVDVEKLATRYDSYSSFKITCICSNTVALMNSEIWPEGSWVRWWRNPRSSNGGVVGTNAY